MNVDEELAKAVEAKKFASTHVHPNWIKLLVDGTVESGTGLIRPKYPDGHQGIPNWTEKELTSITRKANNKGLTMHIHAMGNLGVNRVINTYINGGKDEMRNTLVHVRNVFPEDYKRMAKHNIQVAAGMSWHHVYDDGQKMMSKLLPEGMNKTGYPMKSFFDYGIKMSSHSNYPALCGSPDDQFGIMEIAVTGVYYPEHAKQW